MGTRDRIVSGTSSEAVLAADRRVYRRTAVVLADGYVFEPLGTDAVQCWIDEPDGWLACGQGILKYYGCAAINSMCSAMVDTTFNKRSMLDAMRNTTFDSTFTIISLHSAVFNGGRRHR